ncbi:OmpA family protein [Streptomyces jumonjinensis]|uniref:OmpA family protein n=1 Tax=Streptomyces jumonjinensis TaxID=1945 RepID=A0A646KQ95_STRJU|nr:OmpA family protein [Streptomyces jumonjinensis]MQT04462.1 OmpA family protein [Streptomyces jumonjinensis]
MGGIARRRTTARRPAAVSLAVAVLLTGFPLYAASAAPGAAPAAPGTAPGAATEDDPNLPPGSQTAYTPPEIDGDDPGLRMRDGATLAQSRVLDIVSIVETEGGEERREETPTSLKFALQAEVLFGKDSARLTPQANSRIAAIVTEIGKNRPRTVRVFGFTDNLGTYPHGRTLSKKRAVAVHGVLSGELNDPGVSYEVRGYSEDYPIADNATEEGRRKNRRVEVSFPTGSAG